MIPTLVSCSKKSYHQWKRAGISYTDKIPVKYYYKCKRCEQEITSIPSVKTLLPHGYEPCLIRIANAAARYVHDA